MCVYVCSLSVCVCVCVIHNSMYICVSDAIITTEPEIATAPLDGLILPGVTRDSILKLAKSWVRYVP